TLEMAPLEIRHRSVRPISAKHAQASRFLQQSQRDLVHRLMMPGGQGAMSFTIDPSRLGRRERQLFNAAITAESGRTAYHSDRPCPYFDPNRESLWCHNRSVLTPAPGPSISNGLQVSKSCVKM
ncbi:hypothetical protein, partial [Novosphingobium sp. ST904]